MASADPPRPTEDVGKPRPTATPVSTGLLATGASFAECVIEGVAGRGGMGVVYIAREARPSRRVALKVISPDLAGNIGFRERFERESELAATIEHSNVLPVYRVGEEAGLLFLITRYVEGTDLAALLAAIGRLEPRRAVGIVSQVCDALDAAHARGLVHRDVKPANVLIAVEGGRDHAYLADFGLTKRSDATGGPTRTGYFFGTIDYAAPEQFEAGRVDARTDVYAAGCMLFHTLTGRVPFPAESAAAGMFAHMTQAPPSLGSTDASLPAALVNALDPIIARAMAKVPDDRYLSAGDFGRAATASVEGKALTRAEHNVATGAAASGEEARAEAEAPGKTLTAEATDEGPKAEPAPATRGPSVFGPTPIQATTDARRPTAPPASAHMPASIETAGDRRASRLYLGGGAVIIAVGIVLFLVLGSSSKTGKSDLVYRSLLRSSIPNSELPAGVTFQGASDDTKDAGTPGYLRGISVGMQSANAGPPDIQSSAMWYAVFKDAKSATSAYHGRAGGQGAFVPPGFSVATSCRTDVGKTESTSCVALVGRVMVEVYTSTGVVKGLTAAVSVGVLKPGVAHAQAAQGAHAAQNTEEVSKSDVESEVAKELAAKVNQPVPKVTCPSGLSAKVGASVDCDLVAQGETAVYAVHVVVDTVKNGTVHFNATVADQPKSGGNTTTTG